MRERSRMGHAAALLLLWATAATGQPARTVDLAGLSDEVWLFRGLGSVGSGSSGVPVAGGHDVDGDGLEDVAFAAMRASPLLRAQAGQVHVLFGDGTTSGTLDTAAAHPRLLQVYGDQSQEHLGSEIWIDDVTGDGIGDLLLCRQDFTAAGRIGSGALTIVAGGPALRTLAATTGVLDLRSPGSLDVLTLTGPAPGARLGMWVRTSDLDGDGIADILVSADQETVAGQPHAGALYLVRGGTHLAGTGTVDLAGFGQAGFPLAGQALKVLPPPTAHGHFASTVNAADLDGDGRAEILASKALSRAGAALQPAGGFSSHATGGTQHGTLFILWSSAVPPSPQPWSGAVQIVAGGPDTTVLSGGPSNSRFSEELLGGLDYDGDGHADLFVGDITGNGPNGIASGLGYVFYRAKHLRGLNRVLPSLPFSIKTTTIYGPGVNAISSDTAAHGDVDSDGHADLMIGSPHDRPFGRIFAGTIHVLLGRRGRWPAVIDLAPGSLPPASEVEIVEIHGANGDMPGDAGDTLCYSAATGDVNGDGHVDLIANEMLGNGSNAVDTGNLIILSGQVLSRSLFADGFEAGSFTAWSESLN